MAAGALLCADAVQACPTCKAALAGHEYIVRGYFWSIVFMMSMPFLLVGLFSAYFYMLVRRARMSGQGIKHGLAGTAVHVIPVGDNAP